MEFKLTKDQVKRVKDWKKKNKLNKLSYEFTPTEIGMVVVAIAQKKFKDPISNETIETKYTLDLTDYNNW